jgi:hypothetical protein
MTYRDTAENRAIWSGQITGLRQKMRDAQASIEPGPVHHHEFVTAERRKRLPHLFGRRRDLFAIDNMGRGCPQCTLLADGFSGGYPHITDRPDTGFEPSEDFCTLWHLFYLLPEGAAGWRAKFSYP